MVSFYKAGKARQPKSAKPSRRTLTVDRLDYQGQGVCSTHQPVVFVDGALPGEDCVVDVAQSGKSYINGRLISVSSPSPVRVTPFCPLIRECGGCQLQHISAPDALALRQQALDHFWRKSFALDTLPWEPPITGTTPEYRRITRLAVDARDPHNFRLGFRKARSNEVVNIPACPVLVPELSRLLQPLQECLSKLSNRQHIGHIGLLAGDQVQQVWVKVTRPVNGQFIDALTAFARDFQVNLAVEQANGDLQWLQQLAPVICSTEEGLSIAPEPNDFVQVNAKVNQQMIAQAMDWLTPGADDVIADWFSGLGNFTLSLAQRGARVQAVEGVAEMVQRAQHNALRLGIESIEWHHLDLSDPSMVSQALAAPFNKVLLDPSREGALTVCQALAEKRLDKILYVSCNPSTFTRDVKVLLQKGYQLDKLSVIEMFPYTRHLEVMALFTSNSIIKAS